MKTNLKLLIESIIRETIINKLVGEGQPVGGVKNDHDFDEGRHGVMKAVNVDEKVGFDGKYVDDMESGVAVKKLHKLDEDDDTIPGTFVDRGQIKLEGGIPEETARKIAEHHWDVFNHSIDDRGVWNFQTRGQRWCCSVGMLNGKPAMLSSTTTPGRLNLLVGKELINGIRGMNEMSASGAAGGYQTPFAFSKRKSGSKRAMDVTTKMGYKKVKGYSESEK